MADTHGGHLEPNIVSPENMCNHRYWCTSYVHAYIYVCVAGREREKEEAEKRKKKGGVCGGG